MATITARMPEIQKGEALVVGWESDEDMTGVEIVGRISVAKGEAVEVAAVFDEPVGGKKLSGYVPFPGSLFPDAGAYYDGTIVFTKDGSPWSPMKENFTGKVGPAT